MEAKVELNISGIYGVLLNYWMTSPVFENFINMSHYNNAPNDNIRNNRLIDVVLLNMMFDTRDKTRQI